MPRPTQNWPSPPQNTAPNCDQTPEPHPSLAQIPEADTRTPEYLEECRRQCLALSAHDPGGDEVMRLIEELYDWPDWVE